MAPGADFKILDPNKNQESDLTSGKEELDSGVRSRETALTILTEIGVRGLTLDEAILQNQYFSSLPRRDRAFVHLLVLTVLRRQGQMDALIKSYLKRPLEKRAFQVLIILRLAAVQLLFLGTPAHAVVNISVAMCRRFPGHKGFVNAVLRRMSEDGKQRLKKIDIRLNTPKWMYQSWLEQFGDSTTREILKTHIQNAPLDITVSESPKVWADKLGGAILFENTVRLESTGNVSDLPGYKNGDWWVQDFSASLPARLLLSLLPNRGKGAEILDLCAAPGGKTAQLAAAGAIVTAVDSSPKRLSILRKNMERLRYEIKIAHSDARKYKPTLTPAGILLDAPCSGTGTIRRNPDILLNKKPTIVTRMAALQLELALAASNLLKPGGVLMYSVCSLQAEEGEMVIEKVLREHSGLKAISLEIGDWGVPVKLGRKHIGYRIVPNTKIDKGGIDGFFLTALQVQ
jgi:16S rRNA (cytosine967-C5)-methyltransferase